MTAKRAAILFCRCETGRHIPDERKRLILASLEASGVYFSQVPDLCAAAAERDPLLRTLAAEPGGLVAVACYPRAVRWLLSWAGADVPEDRLRVLNMREADTGEICRALTIPEADAEAGQGKAPDAPAGGWTGWFPVVDGDRCRRCRQCLNFCPFGVYAADEARGVAVCHPRRCKDQCPACARICPEAAIVFPKHAFAPINGASVRPEDVDRHRQEAQARRVGSNAAFHAALEARRPRVSPPCARGA